MIDGPVLLAEALRAGLAIEDVLAEPGADESVLLLAEGDGARIHRVQHGTLTRATGTVTPQGVASIARTPPLAVDPAIEAASRGPAALVLVGVSDPGNAGTLLRAAEATGAAAVLFCDDSVDPTNPKCVRASAGALFHVAVATGCAAVPTLAGLGRRGARRIATASHGGRDCDRVDLPTPVAIVLGNEAHGLAPDVESLLDELVSIPMVGRSESLNVAMAGSILCYEALRQRRAAEPTR